VGPGDADAGLPALEWLEQAAAAEDGVGDFHRADSIFHLSIAAAAGTPYLDEAVEGARSRFFTPLADVRVAVVRWEGRGYPAMPAKRSSSGSVVGTCESASV
jgi:DNA-binding GntR family transcriptional regulator